MDPRKHRPKTPEQERLDGERGMDPNYHRARERSPEQERLDWEEGIRDQGDSDR